jgi:hypothetical protein
MTKRRQYRELPDVEVSHEIDQEIRSMIDAAERDIAERRTRGDLPGGSSGEASTERRLGKVTKPGR